MTVGDAGRPRITILTPCFNASNFIEDAIHSVSRQEYEGTQHVVIDGDSNDGTQKILAQYRHLDWCSEPDEGQSDALNKALLKAKGEWIGWLNADEFYLPGCFRTLAAAVQQNPEADVIYGDCVFVDAAGRFLNLKPQHRYSRLVLRHLGCYISSCSLFVRKSSLLKRPWDVRRRRMMDWDLYLSLDSRSAEFRYLPFPLAAFRVHAQQVTAEKSRGFSKEHRQIREQHGLPSSTAGILAARMMGRSLHTIFKVKDGGYRRRFAARRYLASRSMRWFSDTDDSFALLRGLYQ